MTQESLPPYSATCSRKDITTHQLFALLARKPSEDRSPGAGAFLADCTELRDDLGLTKLPRYSTLKCARDRL